MSFHNDGDGLSDEKSLLFEDNITQDLEVVVGGGVNLI